MFDEIKNEMTRKICELRIWLSNMRDDDDFSSINKGLFYVYIYGIYEEIVRQTVQKTIEELNARSVKINECIYELYALIFSAEYDSIYGVGNEHKWEKRWDISTKMIENPIVLIPNEIIPTDGKNLRYRQLQSIAKTFGIHDDILPRPEIGGDILEIILHMGIKHQKKLAEKYQFLICNVNCYISQRHVHILWIFTKSILMNRSI